MDLHELLSTAVADLPDAPDLVPEAQRIHHRRTAVTRAGVVAATAALVVGAGTLTIASPWSRHPSSVSVAAGTSPRLTKAEFETQVVKILQSAWPYPGQTVSWDKQAMPPGQEYLGYKVTFGTKSFTLRFMFYGMTATEPYPNDGVVPSACAHQPDLCQTSTTGAYAYVQATSGWQQLIVSYGSNDAVMLQIEGAAGNELTKDQLDRLGQSAGMYRIYEAAAEAGVLVYPHTGPIPSENPT